MAQAEVEGPAASAAAAQGTRTYPGVDGWSNGYLSPGTQVVAGKDGPMGSFFTTMDELQSVNYSQKALWDGLQVAPHKELGPRTQVTIFEVPHYTPAAYGKATANTNWGMGGLNQIYIPNFSGLKPIGTFTLK
ncbi:hypothetical protein [Mucilaginibacter sp.]|uniref:hypothetical protein n=1 Tax=Mucilaginibacter sp. TaxID=1882438 RepID=UPI002606FBE3|nr:hypothetical protein [Mucilaginibacter sp.]